VGESYLAGNGVARDCKQAGEWFRKAAENGAVAGELRLARYFRDGAKGCSRDLLQAAAWYRKAAEQGDVEAQGILGTLYSFGQGVAQDYVEAYFWLNLAASVAGPEQAHYVANRQMIGVHLTTDEVEQVEERTAKWRAAHPR
jgi:TPR repeat protein